MPFIVALTALHRQPCPCGWAIAAAIVAEGGTVGIGEGGDWVFEPDRRFGRARLVFLAFF